MAIRKHKPTSPGRRFMATPKFDEITKTEPEKSLTEPLKRKGGRNNRGRITTRHQGGGHKRRYRVVDFKRLKDGVPAKVAAIEYDPNRSARIALLHYADGAKAYILAPAGLEPGMVVESGPGADPDSHRHLFWGDARLADLSLITLNRAKTARCRMSDRGNDSYVPGTPVERIALVWPLTREVSSLSKRYDAERRLQRHVAGLGRREG